MVQHNSFVKIGHEIIFLALLSLQLIQVRQLSVTGERMCTKMTIVTAWNVKQHSNKQTNKLLNKTLAHQSLLFPI